MGALAREGRIVGPSLTSIVAHATNKLNSLHEQLDLEPPGAASRRASLTSSREETVDERPERLGIQVLGRRTPAKRHRSRLHVRIRQQLRDRGSARSAA